MAGCAIGELLHGTVLSLLLLRCCSGVGPNGKPAALTYSVSLPRAKAIRRSGVELPHCITPPIRSLNRLAPIPLLEPFFDDEDYFVEAPSLKYE